MGGLQPAGWVPGPRMYFTCSGKGWLPGKKAWTHVIELRASEMAVTVCPAPIECGMTWRTQPPQNGSRHTALGSPRSWTLKADEAQGPPGALCSPLAPQKQHVGSWGRRGRDSSLVTPCPPFLLDQVGKSGHSSVEDAQATMELYKLVEVDWEQRLAQTPPKD